MLTLLGVSRGWRNQESSWRRGCGLGLRCGLREGEDYLSAHARVQSERAFLRQRRREVPAVPGEGTHMATLAGMACQLGDPRHDQRVSNERAPNRVLAHHVNSATTGSE